MKKWIYILCIVCFSVLLNACGEQQGAYSIQFDSNGGSDVHRISFDLISEIKMPNHPTKEGYVFDGWFFDDETFMIPFILESLSEDELDNEITLYAKWRIDVSSIPYKDLIPTEGTVISLNLDPNDPNSITGKWAIKDTNDDAIYFVFESQATNQYGKMSIYVVIDPFGKIELAGFIEIIQTFNVEITRSNLEKFIGHSITNLSAQNDITAGATHSYQTMFSMISDIASSYDLTNTTPSLPYASYYGSSYQMTLDSSFVGTKVTHKYIIVGKGTVYLVTGTGEYYDGSEGTITLHVLLDNDGEIIALLLPDDGYGHTRGFRIRNEAYLALFNGLTLSQVEQVVNSNDDLTTGATNTKNLLEVLLRALVSETASS